MFFGQNPQVLACSFPEAQVLAVDRNAHMDAALVASRALLRFEVLPRFVSEVTRRCSKLARRDIYPGQKRDRDQLCPVAMQDLSHFNLCENLSFRHLDLAPSSALMNAARRIGVAWALKHGGSLARAVLVLCGPPETPTHPTHHLPILVPTLQEERNAHLH